jgi:arginase
VRIGLVVVPYHLGHEGIGMGAGPGRILEAGLAQTLEEQGHEVDVLRIRRQDDETNEIGASFAVLRRVSDSVAELVDGGVFPLVLAGNCMTSIAVVAGLGGEVGVVWLDAHADFNTPDTTVTGFQDGMGLAILTGTGWDALRETIPGYHAVGEANVVLVGIRDVDEAEQRRLDASGIQVVRPEDVAQSSEALERLRTRVRAAHLHIDLDVLDPSEGPANQYAVPGGLGASRVEEVVRALGERVSIRAAAVTAYDPSHDPDGRIPTLAARFVTRIAEVATTEAVSA